MAHLHRAFAISEMAGYIHFIVLPLISMTQRKKLPAMIRQNPKAVRFDDACKVAGWLGFIHDGGQGSHRVFKRPGEPIQLNFQNCNGVIPPYQARQLIAMLDKYGE
ncbi:MAG: type II toxin-antitoxin system HicA family toxin [Candidatus Contendobacter sp.]|nr:type II toxin-antitoxin system HicA family toxin [Candidatus Contendobacter sp.]